MLKVIRWIDADPAAWVESRSSTRFFKTWNKCPAFFTTLPLTTTEDGQEGNSDKWRWFTPDGPLKK